MNIELKYYDEMPNITRASAERHPDTLYIFTDNTDRSSGHNKITDSPTIYHLRFHNKGILYYPNVTLAVLRGLQNACPVTTQKYYHGNFKGVNGRWNDSDESEFEDVILKDFYWIKNALRTNRYKTIVMPRTFLNTKISNLTLSRTPKLCTILENQVNRLLEFITSYNSSASPPSDN